MSSASPESKYDPHQVISSLVKEVALKSEQVATDARPTADVRARAVAELLDSNDELAAFRDQFNIPPADPEASTSADSTYLCGNSLGLQPKRTEAYLLEELGKWKRCGVEGHFLGKRPWATIDETVTGLNAQLVGAESPNEVVVMNSLSVNLHLLLTAFYRPTPTRHKIFIEDGAFCSDYHVVKSQILLHGYDPATSLVTLRPREGESTVRTDDVVALIQAQGDSIATVLFPGVQFYSGQVFDIPAITAAAHKAGCRVGFDLAHAAGNVPLRLHEWGVDFAAWCSYKYLNSGPGCIAGAFVHSRFDGTPLAELPRMCGWWGQELKDRFSMDGEWRMKAGAQSFQMSNPSVVSVVCMQAALEVHGEAGMPRLRAKSRRLTAYLEALLAIELGVSDDVAGVSVLSASSAASSPAASPAPAAAAAEGAGKAAATSSAVRVYQLTPRDPDARGCQLSLLFTTNVTPINDALFKRGIVCDVRKPNVLRVSPTPLYNTFRDVHTFVFALKEVLAELAAAGSSKP